jgi:hypothetical protein
LSADNPPGSLTIEDPAAALMLALRFMFRGIADSSID